MSRKFSVEFKLQVIKMYEEGKKGSCVIAREMDIHPSMVLRWVNKYRSLGVEGLKQRSTAQKYSTQFKEKVLSEIRENRSVDYLVCKYNLSPSTIKRWKVEYGMADEEKIVSDEEIDELKEKYGKTKNPDIRLLLEKLEYAKMENDCLKKLATLVQARKEKERKQSGN